ncbi:helix-turn-helix domain-containing protein [Bacillus halotolerans]|uniref:helix-turn-helix domain-containing protein n=1 Tax=Bacillus halotolerans TaxID=260554 RepID=UPI002DBDEE9C|nr:helix-turn-helix domain-containing protein [Bacillus halotolerans]MEC1645879.1 helix-turn-helix domain-containing protein [Bacillus halotolerans]
MTIENFLYVDPHSSNRFRTPYKEGKMTVNQICEITKVFKASLYRKLSVSNH